MAIGRITGPMLFSNLDRQGVNLAIDTNLVYIDVGNRRLGVGNTSPGYTLDVNGNAHIGNLFILGNTISSEAGANIAGIVSFSSATNATSTTTGAVIVSGGTGIQKDLWVGGNIYANTIIASSTSILAINDPLLYLNASNPGTYNYETGFFGRFVGGALNNYQHTGLVRNHTDNYWYVFSNAAEPSGSTINLSNAFIVLDTIKAGGLILANTTPATSTSTGALQVTGGVGIQGSLWLTNTNDVSANIGSIFSNFNTLNANVGAYETTTNANIGTIFNNLNTLNANVGAYENTTNANIGTQFNNFNTLTANVGAYHSYANTQINSINANLGSYENTTNANIGSIYNNLNTLTANVGLYENTTNANIGGIFNNFNTLNANVGAYENTTNANIGTQFNNINSINANLGSYQNSTNANIGTLSSNITTLFSNAATQATTLNSINANIGAYETWANTYIGTNAYGNANVATYLPTYTGNLSPGNLLTSKFYIDTIYSNSSGVITIGISTALGLPIGGNTARPVTPAAGQIRFNSDLNTIEFYAGVGGWMSMNNTITDQQFYGDGINTVFTLNQATTASGILVSMNGTIQQPGTAYTVSGNQITFAEIPQTSDLIDIRFIASATTAIYDNINIDSAAILVVKGANTIVDSFSTTTTRSVKYTISSTTPYDAHMAEVHVIQFGGSVLLTSYGVLNTGANTITYYANVNGSTVNLLANSTTSSQVRIQRIYFNN
jgi:hypothetical protein